MMAQVPKNVISRKMRLKFLLFIWQLSDLEVHISKNKRDIENSFGTVMPYEYSYKKMSKNRLSKNPVLLRSLKVFAIHVIHMAAFGFGGSYLKKLKRY